MGYDFSFVHLVPRPPALPFWAPADYEGRPKSIADVDLVVKRLIDEGGFRKNGTFDNYRSETEDGILYVRVSSDWISVDTHARWARVLALYELILPLQPELLIVDNQTAVFYDSPAFRAFIDASYARKR